MLIHCSSRAAPDARACSHLSASQLRLRLASLLPVASRPTKLPCQKIIFNFQFLNNLKMINLKIKSLFRN
ncbi:MAG: hypothetical protein A2820_02220 [Candidatus Buchananbacteria bacterium RIFCSPHIGHO2_01_FULL_40_35]|nr:MAG: hypothetical protein A2820_02220 [Candidatus Buchananbacteria bacterium RIFCSPHIGHO2_01_FULL_40_35]